MNGVSVYQSISILINIFKKTFNLRSFEVQLSSENTIVKLDSQFNFINIIIDNIERYNTLVQKSMVDSVNKGIIPENISKIKFEDNVSHASQLENLLDFIEFVISSSNNEIQIGTENIQKLWNIFVGASSIEFDKNNFFKWLYKERNNRSTSIVSNNGRTIFNQNERHFLFTQILCKNEFVQKKEMTYILYKCFEKYFGFENRFNKFILYIKGNYKVSFYHKIQGLDSLWEIVFLCNDIKVKEDSLHLLCSLHLNLDTHKYEPEQKQEIWQLFIDKCLENLKSDEKEVINSSILALINFFDTFDGKTTHNEDININNCFPIHVF